MRIIYPLIFINGLLCKTLLKSNFVNTCSPNQKATVQIKELLIELDSSSSKLNAKLSGSLTEPLTKGNVALQLSVLGTNVFSITQDLCNNPTGLSPCPIKPGEFDLPYSIDVPSNVPNLANIITSFPGANVEVTLKLEDGNKNPIGCVSVGLGSPVSASQPGIVAGTASIAGASVLLSGLSAVVTGSLGAVLPAAGSLQVRPGPSPSAADVLGTMQFMASTGMLNLKYPPVYEQFTTNFAWSMGAIRISAFEKALDKMRPDEFKLTPIIDGMIPSDNSTSTLKRRALENFMPDKNATGYSELAGIHSYSKKLNIQPKNYFTTVLIIILCVAAGITGLCLLMRLALELLAVHKPHLFLNLRNHFAMYYVGNLLRVFMLCYFIVATAALFQLTMQDYWVVTVLAVIVLALFCVGIMGFVTFRIIRAGPRKLYSSVNLQYKYGSLYSDYRAPTYMFFIIVLISSIIRAVAVGMLSEFPFVQMVVLVATELGVFIALFFARPYATKVSNGLMVFIGIMRIVNTGLLFAFIESINLPDLARTIIGIAMIVVQAIMILAILIMTLWSLGVTVYKLIKGENNEQDYQSTFSEQPINKDYETMGNKGLSSYTRSDPTRDQRQSRVISLLEQPEDSKPAGIFARGHTDEKAYEDGYTNYHRQITSPDSDTTPIRMESRSGTPDLVQVPKPTAPIY